MRPGAIESSALRFRRLPVLAALFAAAALPARAETLSDRVSRYAGAAVSPQASAVANAAVEIGREKLLLKSGRLAPVVAGGETIGFFFRGEGTWTYTSDSPDELAVVRRNLEQAAHWKSEGAKGKLTLTDGFSEVLWIEPGAKPPAGSATAPPLEADFRKHQEWFSRLKTESLAQRLAYRALQDPAGRLAWAELAGGKAECLYVFDEVEDHDESLSILEKNSFDSANAPWEWRRQEISRQPLGRKFREPAPVALRLAAADVEVEADGPHATIVAAEVLVPEGAPAKALRLELQSRVFFGTALDIREEKLAKVTGEDGGDVAFDHRAGFLLIELPSAAAAGAPLKLRFTIEGDLLYRPEGDNFWLLGYSSWFPRPNLAGSSFAWKCRLRVRKPFMPILNGRETERKQDGDWNVAAAEFDHPIFYPVVMAGKYSIEEEKEDGRVFRIASYAYVNHRATEHLSKLASQIIKFYEPFLGPFPQPEFTIVEIDSYGFGVAPPGMMFITREAFSQHEDDLTKLFSQGLNERFAHEIAHQYWGDQVQWADDLNEWLSESFAEYCAGLALRRIKGDGAYRSVIGDWEQRTHDVGDHATVATANRLVGERSFFDRTNLLYGKGPYLLHVLNQELGDQIFLTALKTYQSNRKWRGGSTALFENLLEFLTKKSQADFFDRYYWGTEAPKPGQ